MTEQTETITLSPATQRFYQGAAAGSRIYKEHAEVKWPTPDARVKAFFFYGGALAAGEYGCTTSDDFSNFMLGLVTRQPSHYSDHLFEEEDVKVEVTDPVEMAYRSVRVSIGENAAELTEGGALDLARRVHDAVRDLREENA